MRSAIGLGLRLAWGDRWRDGGRRRTVLLALACAIGTAVVAATERIALSTLSRNPRYAPGFIDLAAPVLLLACAVVPALVLVGVAGRMAAESRERRLAALRLLGLTAGRVRLVAAAELAVAALAGIAMGFLGADHLGGLGLLVPLPWLSWPPGDIHAADRVGNRLVIGSLVLGAAVLPSLLAVRGRSAVATATVRRVPPRLRSWLRVLPLATGLALCRLAGAAASAPGGARAAVPVLLFAAGVVVIALGLVTATPVVVRLLGDLLVRVGKRRPAALVAGRQLQAQPAAAHRVVATLLVALFLGTAAQATVAAQEQLGTRWVPAGEAAEQVLYVTHRDHIDAIDRDGAILRDAPGVRQVTRYGYLSGCDATGVDCTPVLVATCAALTAVEPSASGCVEGQPYRLKRLNADGVDLSAPLPATLTLRRPCVPDREPVHAAEATATFRAPTQSLTLTGPPVESFAGILLPPDAPELAAVRSVEGRVLHLTADFGSSTRDYLRSRGIAVEGRYVWQASEAVLGPQRQLTLGVTLLATVLGLFAFAIAYVDRLAERRAEVVGLQLLGAPRSVLRIGHLWEMATPLVAGSLLAIGLGRLVGDLYLMFGWPAMQRPQVPASVSLGLTVAVLLGSGLLALLTAVVANPRLRPELIRTT